MQKNGKNAKRNSIGYELDALDTKILNMLNDNARKSFRQIAKELDVSMNTISKRVKGMEGAGIIIRYAPVLDSQKLGFDILAIIGVRISKGKQLDVQNKISKLDKVFAVYDITGEWDSLIIARFRTRSELNQFIKSMLGVEYIERTYTQIVLNVVKDESRVLLP